MPPKYRILFSAKEMAMYPVDSISIEMLCEQTVWKFTHYGLFVGYDMPRNYVCTISENVPIMLHGSDPRMEGVLRSELLDAAFGGAVLSNWTIAVFGAILLILTFAEIINGGNYTTRSIAAMFNLRRARRSANSGAPFMFDNLLGNIASILILSLFLFHAFVFFGIEHVHAGGVLFLLCTMAVLMWSLIKQISYKCAGIVFRSENISRSYISSCQSSIRALSLILCPITFIMFFTRRNLDILFLSIGLVPVMYSVITSLFEGFVIIREKVFSIYYPILYLCTLEIGSVVIVAMVMSRLI